MTTLKEKSGIWEWVRALLIAILFVFIIRTFFFTPIVVKGSSMEPTLHNKEHMIVTKIGEPQRFDIVVFHASKDEDYIKRVIGLPGDRIEHKDDILYINGEPYDEPYLNEYKQEVMEGPLTWPFTLQETPVGSDVVPDGHLFVMGDNRRESKDSRRIGAIPMEEVVGVAKIVYFPFKDLKIVGE